MRPKKSTGEPSFSPPELDLQPKMITPEEKPKQNPLIHKPINRRPINIDSIEAMTPETDYMVTGTFINIECPGQPAKVSGKYYRGMEYFSEVMEDNKSYKIPLSVARYINENICHDQHKYVLDANGSPSKSYSKVFRYKFMIEKHHEKHAQAA